VTNPNTNHLNRRNYDMSATTNGKAARKQLSDQLDRLDAILDGLADALNEAVADAAREGARVAVKEAILEVLTNPDLRAVIARADGATSTATAPKPSLLSRLRARMAGLRRRAVEAVKPVAAAAAGYVPEVGTALAAVGQVLGVAWRLRKVLLIGVAVGAVTAAVAYISSPAVSAAIGGVGGVVAALAVQGAVWVRRMTRGLGRA
jgi:hypothetical protein